MQILRFRREGWSFPGWLGRKGRREGRGVSRILWRSNGVRIGGIKRWLRRRGRRASPVHNGRISGRRSSTGADRTDLRNEVLVNRYVGRVSISSIVICVH